MFVVHTRIPFDPDRRATATAAARRVAERAREEPGVVAYHATVELGTDPVLQFVERYEDEDALEAHVRTEHYEQFTDELAEFVDGEMETLQLEVARSWSATFGVDDL